MRIKLFLLAFSLIAVASCSAQSFFGPFPKGPAYARKMSLSVVDSSNLTMNAVKPVVVISALVSDGTELAGGFGAGFGHYIWNEVSQSWVTVYSISAVAFLGTNGSKITGTGGLVFGIPGTNGTLGAGPGYNITLKQWSLLTNVIIQFK